MEFFYLTLGTEDTHFATGVATGLILFGTVSSRMLHRFSSPF